MSTYRQIIVSNLAQRRGRGALADKGPRHCLASVTCLLSAFWGTDAVAAPESDILGCFCLAPNHPQGSVLQASWWDRTAKPAGGVQIGRFRARTDLPSEGNALITSVVTQAGVSDAEWPQGVAARSTGIANLLLFGHEVDYLETLRVRFGVNAKSGPVLMFRNSLGSGIALCMEGSSDLLLGRLLAAQLMRNQLIVKFGTDLPPWLGTALEMNAEGGGGLSRLRPAIVTDAVLEVLRPGDEGRLIPPLAQLIRCKRAEWEGGVGRRGAANSIAAWSLLQFLLHGDEGKYRGSLERVLVEVSRGVAGADAWHDVFGDDEAAIAAMERSWRDWLGRLQVSPISQNINRLQLLAEGLKQLQRRGVEIKSIDQLWEALAQEDFSTVDTCYGIGKRLSASDPAMRQLVEDRPNPSRRKGGARLLIQPGKEGPPGIATEGLLQDMEVTWTSEEGGQEWRWRIQPYRK